ncbi:acetylornithine aminotransferase [Alicyclobacillus contaminans]|uniref:aspartate aminotransferase family protein n=1 Tax=Alicyclobacillus contaminans TaxID=392016 RepID=UPI000407B34B|nr:acetylornithine/succinylornithine family transaminase [Alicyclobacillus contaminans]GMA50610.1 acetylornithine aminotransferase [Alicyclobacillus contaminans]
MTPTTQTSALMGNYAPPAIELVRGEGPYVYSADGREYLDFTAGIAVCNLGHAHPAVTEAIIRQAGLIVHTSNLYGHALRGQVAARLAELSRLDQVFFCNSGAEANEAALKLARKAAAMRGEADRVRFVSLPGGFHGRTFGALSVTPKPAYHAGFEPLLPECTAPETFEAAVEAIDERTAACIVEVVQGEGGVHPVPTEVLRAIQARCRAKGALLIIDEVQTGVGRTGTFFAYEAIGLEPDIVTMAKGLGNGVPIGAVLARKDVAAAFTPGSHGSTFGGNLLAMAAAQAVLEHVAAPDFLAHVRRVGAYLQQQLTSRFPEVTGRGLMWGITVPDASAFVQKAAEAGLLLTAVAPTRVRWVPPLIIDTSHVDEAMTKIQALV